MLYIIINVRKVHRVYCNVDAVSSRNLGARRDSRSSGSAKKDAKIEKLKRRVAKLKANQAGEKATMRRYMTPKTATVEGLKKLAGTGSKVTRETKKADSAKKRKKEQEQGQEGDGEKERRRTRR